MKIAFIFLVCLTLAFASDYTYDEGVVVLTSKNFEKAISEFEYALVEFYAPWCKACKNSAPQYASAAQKLAQTNPEIKLCKVDATAERSIATKYGITGYPTTLLFSKNRSSQIKYDGGYVDSQIIAWLKKKAGPLSKEVKSVEDVEQYIRENEVLGLFFGPSTSESYESYITALNELEDVVFVHTNEQTIKDKYGLAEESFVFLKQGDESKDVFTGPIQTQDLKDFIEKNKYPTILSFDAKYRKKIMGGAEDVLFLIIDKNQEGALAEEAFRTASKDLKGKITMCIGRMNEPFVDRLADYVGAPPRSLPAIRIKKANSKLKFMLELQITPDNIKKFAEDFLNDKLSPFLKSEPIPEKPYDGNVRAIVGKTFKDIVLDEQNDVLVEYYTPWSQPCKAFAPTYNALADRLKNVNGLVIGKLDPTANEIEGLLTKSFPTIRFYTRGNKESPIEFTGEKTEEALFEFIKQHATVPIPDKIVDIDL